MNLGQAVAICLYELACDRKSAPQPEEYVHASAADLERLTSLMLDALRTSGYLKTPPSVGSKMRSAALSSEKIRRLIRRLNFSAKDAELFLGILRQILWKLRS